MSLRALYTTQNLYTHTHTGNRLQKPKNPLLVFLSHIYCSHTLITDNLSVIAPPMSLARPCDMTTPLMPPQPQPRSQSITFQAQPTRETPREQLLFQRNLFVLGLPALSYPYQMATDPDPCSWY